METILGISKQRALMIPMKIVCVLAVNKVSYDLSGPFAKFGASQADNDTSNPPDFFHKNIFLIIF